MAQATTRVNAHLADNFPYKLHDQEVVTDAEAAVGPEPSNISFRKESATFASTHELRVCEGNAHDETPNR